MPIIESADGSHTILSDIYNVTYHSKHGAITETDHVFIGMGLHWKATEKNEISVLEVGFGTGLNAFMSWLEAERRGWKLHYQSLETHPISAEEAADLNYPKMLDEPTRSSDFMRLHKAAWDQPLVLSDHFTLEKKLLRLQDFVPDRTYDVIFFDAFAPQAQPELWEEVIFARLAQAMNPGGGLVTYCAQGEFRRRLRRAGFTTERLPGPPGKREMTRGVMGH
ncbi:MAG TPA: tRNA (5-methylaminomethyl-2-thiouridine)(34)-methyltransferase MnmD [Saprospiraceae bacterium]|nr:tRNA (5-methylaminomethyl-2-thiouridine)(34)-methyltransferase MnmD [Saprospiraceae bacterium]